MGVWEGHLGASWELRRVWAALLGCGSGGGVLQWLSPMQVTLGVAGEITGRGAAFAQPSCCCGTPVGGGEGERVCGAGTGRITLFLF